MIEDIILPTLHKGQVEAYLKPARFLALRNGRRWGKTELIKCIVCDGAIKGRSIGFFTPDYKIQSEAYNEIAEILYPIIRASSKVDGVIRLITGGRIDFWTLNNPRAGRSRKYHTVVLDEVAFAGNDMPAIWAKSIRPTLLDYGGNAIAASTPNGNDSENWFWQICNLIELGFKEYHAPTHSNPYLEQSELDKLQIENSPLVYSQEYMANFVDWKGASFFQEEKMLDDGIPVDAPIHPEYIFAVLDTATKTGKEHDGTAYTICAKYAAHGKYPLVILDWGIVQIDGHLLISWLPQIYQNAEMYARELKARHGSIGALIEEKSSGTILIKQAEQAGLQVNAIDSKLTAMGKSERAISVSSYFYQGMVKLSKHAYNKTMRYKEIEKNHLIGQLCGFRIGVDNGEDDLADCAIYSAAVGLGNADGY